MRPRLLPGVRHADLCHTIRAAPVRLSAGAQRDRPARTIWAAVAVGCHSALPLSMDLRTVEKSDRQ
jgi:hypothetical protein